MPEGQGANRSAKIDVSSTTTHHSVTFNTVNKQYRNFQGGNMGDILYFTSLMYFHDAVMYFHLPWCIRRKALVFQPALTYSQKIDVFLSHICSRPWRFPLFRPLYRDVYKYLSWLMGSALTWLAKYLPSLPRVAQCLLTARRMRVWNLWRYFLLKPTNASHK